MNDPFDDSELAAVSAKFRGYAEQIDEIRQQMRDAKVKSLTLNNVKSLENKVYKHAMDFIGDARKKLYVATAKGKEGAKAKKGSKVKK